MLQQNNTNSWHGLLRVKPAHALILFICWWVLAWVFGSVVIARIGVADTTEVRLATIIQDIIMFIVPTVMTMGLIAHRPWRTMGVATLPPFRITVLGIGILLASIPCMNSLVLWNQNIHFPAGLSDLESALRNAEQTAESMVSMVMGQSDVVNLVISILIIGVLTGIAEEVFFRGGLQQLLTSLTGNVHVAIWITAIVFSAIHMQFFGFFPRVLMGAFFGYLLYWSGSLWLPVIAHALNNSIVVVFTWLSNQGNVDAIEFENFGTTWQWCLCSVVLTSFLIWRLLHLFNQNKRTIQKEL